jgi:hypothetical protein
MTLPDLYIFCCLMATLGSLGSAYIERRHP